MMDAIQIGEWSFTPASAELMRNGRRRALEDRAARVLALLADQRGAVVSHEELITKVWGGRSVSANSVAVVIGDLRKALGDDAKAPRYIQTVAKRGYRLAAADSAMPNPQRARILLGIAAASAALAFGGALMASTVLRAPARPAVAVAEVGNETGDARYAPLARAVTELVVSNASSNPRALNVRRTVESGQEARVVVNGRLILWSGHPSVSLSAVDQQTGQVVWSGIAPGPEDSLPGQVQEQVAAMKAALPLSLQRPPCQQHRRPSSARCDA
jgi:DNA-binding winged helix-turn-helix (wHTH) protein